MDVEKVCCAYGLVKHIKIKKQKGNNRFYKVEVDEDAIGYSHCVH